MNMSDKHFVSTVKLSLASEIPMYMQLANYFKKQIKSGKIKPKDKLISEMDIVKLLGISRTTVRLAFEYLEAEGLIIRLRGKGSYVAEPNIRRIPGCFDNFTENIIEKSLLIISNKIQPADTIIKEKLKLSNNENCNVFISEQIICSSQIPIIKQFIYIPYHFCPGIENMNLSEQPIYLILQNKYGLKIEKSEEIIESVITDENTAGELQCPIGIPGYRIDCITKLKSGIPCEYKISFINSEKCKIKILSERNKSDFTNFELRSIN